MTRSGWREAPMLLNSDEIIGSCLRASSEYLNSDEPLRLALADHMHAYYEIGDLIPETLERVGSGHNFPHSQSYTELESAYQLAVRGFYTHGFAGLRSVLELGVLGVYFAISDEEHLEVSPWIRSEAPTPWFRREMIPRLASLESFAAFDGHFGLSDRMADSHDRLSRYVHTRGIVYSSQELNRSNTNSFSEIALKTFSRELQRVLKDLVIVMLLKFPVGMQGLPLTEKFGLNGPAGGFLESFQVEWITMILDDEERAFIQRLSDGDPEVVDIVKEIESLPDLSEEKWEEQRQWWDEKVRPHELSRR